MSAKQGEGQVARPFRSAPSFGDEVSLVLGVVLSLLRPLLFSRRETC